MARAEPPASIEEIRKPQSTQSHINALKALKHDIIGHEQRKELAVHHGVIPLLSRNLSAAASEKQSRKRELSREEEHVLVQTVQIVTCLAHGGLAFAQPVVQSGIVAALLEQLSPSTTSARLVVESLRAVAAIADALATDVLPSPESSGLAGVAQLLFAKSHVHMLVELLAQRTESMVVDEQITLVLRIISTCLRDERNVHQPTLVKAGVLDYICCRLASLVEAMGCATHSRDPAFVGSMLPAPPRSSLQHLLEALGCLCHKSAYRSMRIVYSRHLLEVFPIASPHSHTPGDYLSFSDQSSPLPLSSNPIDHFLPKLQAVQSKNEHSFSKAFPALGSFSSSGEGLSGAYYGEGHTTVSGRTISADEFGSPLIAWLIHVARHSTGLERMAALEFLAKLISALDQKIMDSWTESSRNRDRTLAFLVVPLLVRIIDAADPKNTTSRLSAQELAATRMIRERAPIALAILISDATALQRAAHDASAIDVFSKALKKSFDAVAAVRKPMWTPVPQGSAMDISGELGDPTCSLGTPAMPAENIHRFRYRAASMQALAALAAANDNYRKLIIDANITSCLIDSLVPYPDGPVSAVQQAGADSTSGKDGNPWFVVAAACKLATALSRCVGVLRTKLLDAGLAKPVFSLLNERDHRLKAAGLDVATNLLLHFSPMREELITQGVVKVICGHAHSADPELRHSALWALKNLCAATSKEVKSTIIEELGTGWLIQIMAGESLLSHGARPHMATPNSAGEQVDLLNADEPGMDIDEAEEDTSSEEEDEDDESQQDGDFARTLAVPAQHRARLHAIRREEESPSLRARRSDIRIQTKVIDLVRNIICDAGPKQPEMVDSILQNFGQHRLFEVLASKLKPRAVRVGGKSTHSYSGAPAGKRPTLTTPAAASSSQQDKEVAAHLARIDAFPTHLYPPDDIINNTLFTLIHIANGRPSHRHMILNVTTPLSPQQSPASVFPSSIFPARFLPQAPQAKLLDLILPLFWHPDPRIRVACCWMVHNILWMEDAADSMNSRQRATELRQRGFEDAVRSCCHDEHLDVKERAKGNLAMWQ